MYLQVPTKLNQEPIFYVYALFRPWNGQPCYIGKGHGDRILYHAYGRNSHRNQHLKRILKKAETLGLCVPRIKIREGLTETEALKTEIALIAAIGRKAHGGPLANLTDGGEGTSGHVHTQEARQKIGAAGIGREFSVERRAKIGAGHKGLRHTEETKERIRLKKIGTTHAPTPEEVRRKISASLKGKKHSPERCANIIAAINKPETRAKREQLWARYRGVPLTPETKAKISAAKKGRKQTAEQRAVTSQRIKEVWAKRKLARQHTGADNNANFM